VAGSHLVNQVTEEQNDIAQKLQTLRAAVHSLIEKHEAAMVLPAPAPSLLEKIQAQWRIEEHPFISHIPLLGPLIARFRQGWNNVATTWYVRPLLQQQNDFNRLLAQHLQEIANLYEEIDTYLTQNDRDVTALARQIAELSATMVRLENQLEKLEHRLEKSPGQQ
jgi:uncharacterized coiled-coil DUF342 family protein